MALKQLDILAKPVPAEVSGIYDIVHVRFFVSIIVKSDVTPLLTTTVALLGPGGYLQWEDSRIDRFVVESPSAEISTTACDTILRILRVGGEARGLQSDWVDALDRHLDEHGFEDVGVHLYDLRKQNKVSR